MIKPESWYSVGKIITVNDKMQRGYKYALEKPYGNLSDLPEFQPFFTPQEMLKKGIFEGKYLNDCIYEFPSNWYKDAISSLAIDGIASAKYNFFKIKSRQSLTEWKRKNWIYGPDVRGWFQWYCRLYIGRRIPEIDKIQINRWKAFRRHRGAIQSNCPSKDLDCRPKQRQALLQWSYDPFL
jgi:hypothetical protein